MTCGKKCRLRRRARQEQVRRKAALPAVLELERARQRHHRARQVASAGTGPPLSRAGLSAQASEVIKEIIEKLGHAQQLSRAGLRRRLHRLVVGEIARADAKAWT